MTSIFHDAFFSVLSALVPYVLAAVAVFAVSEFSKLRKWFMAEVWPKVSKWIDAHTTKLERDALDALARQTVIAVKAELAKNPDTDVLKWALAFFNAHMSKILGSITEAQIIAAIKDAEAKLAAEQGRQVTKALAI